MAAQAGVVVQVLMRGRGGTTRARARSQGHWGEEDRRGNGVHPELDRWQEGWGGSSSKEQESRVMDGEEEGGGVAQEDLSWL